MSRMGCFKIHHVWDGTGFVEVRRAFRWAPKCCKGARAYMHSKGFLLGPWLNAKYASTPKDVVVVQDLISGHVFCDTAPRGELPALADPCTCWPERMGLYIVIARHRPKWEPGRYVAIGKVLRYEAVRSSWSKESNQPSARAARSLAEELNRDIERLMDRMNQSWR